MAATTGASSFAVVSIALDINIAATAVIATTLHKARLTSFFAAGAGFFVSFSMLFVYAVALKKR